MKQNLNWLENPRVFKVGRLDAHSDHAFFRSLKNDLQQSLNGTWKIRVDEKPADRPIGFEAEDFDASSWQDIQVPGSIQCQNLAPHHYTNTIYPWDGHDHLRPPHISWEHNLTLSYVRDFTASPSEGEDVILEFNGVETAFYVWVNGELAGYAEDSFTPSRFNITDLIHPGTNRLAVQVFQRSSASWLEDQDMFRMTGIFRDVNLVFWPKLHLKDLYVTTDDSSLKVQIQAKTAPGARCSAVLMDADRVAGSWQGPLSEETSFVIPVDNPRLWSPETPHLYELKIELLENGQTVEQTLQPVGFRTITLEDGVLKVNGKRIVFRGTNRHEFDPVHGRTLPLETMEKDAEIMKELNINAVRTSHYPNHSYWYELADRTGLWIIDEANLESHGSWQKLGACEPSWNVPGNDPAWTDAVVDRLQSMIERDKNHPSIVLWSLGNESYAGTGLVAMHDWAHEHEPTRPVHYEGVFWNRDYDRASDIESRMYAKPHEIEEYLQSNPEKPYISCEFEHAMGNSLGNLDEYMALEKYDQYQGGFIWDYVDQAIQSEKNGKTVYLYGGDFGDVPNDFNFSGNGLLLADRTLTPKAHELKKLYSFLDLEAGTDSVTVKNGYTFRSTEGIRFDWQLKKDGVTVRKGDFRLKLEPGQTESVQIGWSHPSEPGVWTKTVTASENGREIGWGQKTEWIQEEAEAAAPAAVVTGDGNFSFSACGTTAFFQHGKGLISLKKGKAEFLQGPVRPEVFRALTDNDEGAGYAAESGIWEAAQKYASVSGFDLDEKNASVTFHYALPFVSETISVCYAMDQDGRLHISAVLPANPDRPLLPVFGLRITMPETYDQIKWLGQGPADTYPDRAHQNVDLYASTREEEFVNYLRPQEHGNHMETYSASVEDKNRSGLQFQAAGAPFQFTASAYSSEELQNALHPYELPAPYQTVVRIASAMQGVGGDDSWGAPVHDPYLLDGSQDLTLHFVLEAKAE